MVFPTSDKKNCARKDYSKTDMLYDIKHGHLQFDWTPVTVGQKKEAADNKAELVEEAHALSQMSTGAEPLNRREAKCRPDWPEWLCAEQRELFSLQLSVCLWWHDYRRDDFPTSTLKFWVVMADLLAIC